MYNFIGLTEEQSLGNKYTSAFHPDDLPSWPSLKDVNLHFQEMKLRIRKKDGQYKWHLARAIYLPTSGGKVYFYPFFFLSSLLFSFFVS